MERAKVYCIGICGTGLSNLALFLHTQGCEVSGSDLLSAFYTRKQLSEAGIPVYEGFTSSRIDTSIDRVIYSPAYAPDACSELRQAEAYGIPMQSYPEALAELSREYPSVFVAGSHGKTTSAVMTARGFLAAGVKAAALTGTVSGITFCRTPEVLVIEACEYRRHFLRYLPAIALVTSVDYDHVDCYRDREAYRQAFREFCGKVSDTLVIHEDAYNQIGPAAAARVSYGGSSEYAVIPVDREAGRYRFEPWGHECTFTVPGDHIAEDGLGALLACNAWMRTHRGSELNGQELLEVIQGIASYPGAVRRCERIGESGGVLFYDDYAHHPREIEATLTAFRQRYPRRRLVVDFVPHTVSRTKAFLHEFAQALSAADAVCIQEIYQPSREKPPAGGLSGADLADLVRDSRFFPDYETARIFLAGFLKPGDLFITMGAGDNRSLGASLAAAPPKERT